MGGQSQGEELNLISGVAVNAVTGPIDEASLAAQSLDLAWQLGYENDAVVTFTGYDGKSQAYRPGWDEYNGIQHISGLTSVVLRAPTLKGDVAAKVEALNGIVNSVNRAAGDQDSAVAIRLLSGRVGRAVARGAVIDEVRTLARSKNNYTGDELTLAADAKDVQWELRRMWHPYRRGLVTVGLAGLAAAAVVRSRAS